MQKVWENYQAKGVVMIGVPSNDFGQQEPGSNEEIVQYFEKFKDNKNYESLLETFKELTKIKLMVSIFYYDIFTLQ